MHTRNDLIIFYEMPTKNIPSYNESDSQVGITDEQASFWWNTLNEDLLKKFALKYKHKKWLREVWGSLPVNVKNDFKKWLITKEAKRGIKISNNSEHGGGKLSGKYHTSGGIKAVIRETGKPVEVENEELITAKGVSQSEDIVTCTGKPEAIVSDLNVKYGGDKISDKRGGCSIIKKHIMKKGEKINSKIYTNKQGDKFYVEKDGKFYVVKGLNKGDKKSDEYDAGGGNYSESEAHKVAKNLSKDFYENESFEKGSKIKSHIDNRKIERMIIRENELKRADNGLKIDADEQAAKELQEKNEYILITEPEVYAIMQFVEAGLEYEYKKAVPRFIWRGNEICIYHYNQDLINFLNKYGIHYKIYEHRDELLEYLKSLLPQRVKNRIQ